jgi:tRNA(fMet)-specific endonuclease VapC
MPRRMLDTNILSDLIHWPGGSAAAAISRLTAAEQESLCTSIVVAAELRFGVEKSGSPRLAARVEAILERVQILSLDPGADRFYGSLRAQLERSGTPIGANDMLIAAHALAAGCVLVTDNEREFRRVPHLSVENWLGPHF